MRIGMKNGDYTFHITEWQLDDLISKGSKLVKTLLEQEFTLQPSTNIRSTEGIDLSYSPDGSNFSNATQVIIKTSLRVLDRVRHGELVNTKYNGRNHIFIRKDYS